jgi:GNAT superfamily N-acetyltransferase
MNISPLKKEHRLDVFDYGTLALNTFLKNRAFQSEASPVSRTYILSSEEGQVIGYYSLVYGSISPWDVPEGIRQGAGNYPVPLIIIARLAIDQCFQQKGFGKALLKDALRRCLQASEIAGLRAVVVNAKDEKAKNFYERFGFEASVFDEYHLFLLMKDLRKNST